MLLTDFDFGYAWVFPIERWPAASSEGCLNLSTIHLAIWRVHVNSRVRMHSSLITAELFSDVSNLSSLIVHFEEWGSIFPWWWWCIIWLALQVGNEWIKLNMPHSRLRTRKAKLARKLARELRFLLITQDYRFTMVLPTKSHQVVLESHQSIPFYSRPTLSWLSRSVLIFVCRRKLSFKRKVCGLRIFAANEDLRNFLDAEKVQFLPSQRGMPAFMM